MAEILITVEVDGFVVVILISVETGGVVAVILISVETSGSRGCDSHQC